MARKGEPILLLHPVNLFLDAFTSPEMVEARPLPEPSRELDAALHEIFVGQVLYLKVSGPIFDGRPVPAYTSSVDAILALCASVFPGWDWSLRKTRTADIVTLTPSKEDPTAADDLQASGLEVSCSPQGRPALALCAALMAVVAGRVAGGQPRPDGAEIRLLSEMVQNGEPRFARLDHRELRLGDVTNRPTEAQ